MPTKYNLYEGRHSIRDGSKSRIRKQTIESRWRNIYGYDNYKVVLRRALDRVSLTSFETITFTMEIDFLDIVIWVLGLAIVRRQSAGCTNSRVQDYPKNIQSYCPFERRNRIFLTITIPIWLRSFILVWSVMKNMNV